MRYFSLCLVAVVMIIQIGCDSDGIGGLDSGDGLFKFPWIEINYPRGNETFFVGQQVEIKWRSYRVDYIKINLNPGADSIRTITPNTEDDGSFIWTVPNTPFGSYWISVADLDNNPYEMSRSFYITDSLPPDSIIVLFPDKPRCSFYANWDIIVIKWTWHGAVGNVEIDLSTDGGSTWTHTITEDTPNDGSYNWQLGDLTSDSCRVRVSELDGDPWDMSDLDFKIK